MDEKQNENQSQSEKRGLIVPLESNYYMSLIRRLEQHRKERKQHRAIIAALLVVNLLLVAFGANMAGRFVAKSDELDEMTAQNEALQAQVVELESQNMELESQNMQLTEQLEGAVYPLTEQERELVSGIVEAEAGNQGFHGQILVAQCIRNAAEIDGFSIAEVFRNISYAEPKKASDSAKQAVSAVFDRGAGVTSEPILYFYDPSLVESAWHETQRFVLEHKDHRFFARNSL